MTDRHLQALERVLWGVAGFGAGLLVVRLLWALVMGE